MFALTALLHPPPLTAPSSAPRTGRRLKTLMDELAAWDLLTIDGKPIEIEAVPVLSVVMFYAGQLTLVVQDEALALPVLHKKGKMIEHSSINNEVANVKAMLGYPMLCPAQGLQWIASTQARR
jgi:hypothetical protein